MRQLSVICLILILGGCAPVAKAVDGILPDRFGVGSQRGSLEGEYEGLYGKSADRDLKLWELYLEWDVPQLYEEDNREAALLRAILEELRRK